MIVTANQDTTTDKRVVPDSVDRADPLEKPFEPPLGVHPHQDELLDEGVEETFPASDPVSVKRIT